ncbi:MAG TPA: MBL fold metallo-hydrolase [Pseudonocardiaceae bacterium]|nr:MBL fold metallo-hydrolase [Pseudonocardiaceae bacterium]
MGNLDVRWQHGSPSSARNTDPLIQVHAYDEHTFILRQNKAVHYEAPFMFLLCGNERALLLDTGATEDAEQFPLRATVDRLLADRLAAHPRDGYELVVAHTHGHGDHHAGDGQFTGRPDTGVIPVDVDAVRGFFGITDWPKQVVRYDLGGRVLDVVGIPGHQAASIAIFDPWTGFLFTGDTVCRGRLYVKDFPAFVDSIRRLVDFAAARDVTWVLGCHIEMTTKPGRDYPIGTTYQPAEPPLQLPADCLTTVRDAAESVADRLGVHVFDDFIIYHGPCTGAVLRQAARGLGNRLVNRVRAIRKPAG